MSTTTQGPPAEFPQGSLVAKVYGLLSSEDDSMRRNCQQDLDDVSLTKFEDDLRDWGLIYGLAFAIARGEDAFEPVGTVAERAFEAAKAAYARYAGEMADPPSRDREMRKVYAAYTAFRDSVGFPKDGDPTKQVRFDLDSAVLEAGERLGVMS